MSFCLCASEYMCLKLRLSAINDLFQYVNNRFNVFNSVNTIRFYFTQHYGNRLR